jgi:transmembrane sensor
MEEHQIDLLIKKYLNNSASPEEIQALNNWYRSVNNEPLTSPYQNLEEELSAKQNMLARLQQQINSHQHLGKKKGNSLYKYVAAAAIIIAGSWYALTYHRFGNFIDPAKQLTTTTQFGQHKIIHLGDGSTVWLSSGSKITYPEKFTAKLREVYFEGEAYFKIAKDKSHPFIIHTGQTNTKVLGTSFNVKSFKDKGSIEVALVEGKVSFSTDNTAVTLLPQEMVVYNKANGKINKSKFKDINAILMRREGEFNYDNVSIKEIAEELTRNFNIKIAIEGGVKDCTFYGRLKKNESVDKFLHKMGIIVNAKVTKSTNGYLIKGGGCK